MRDQSYLAEKGAYPWRPKRRLFSAYLSVRNVCALLRVAGNVERKRPRDNRASLLRLDERVKRATRLYDRVDCYASSS